MTNNNNDTTKWREVLYCTPLKKAKDMAKLDYEKKTFIYFDDVLDRMQWSAVMDFLTGENEFFEGEVAYFFEFIKLLKKGSA